MSGSAARRRRVVVRRGPTGYARAYRGGSEWTRRRTATDSGSIRMVRDQHGGAEG